MQLRHELMLIERFAYALYFLTVNSPNLRDLLRMAQGDAGDLQFALTLEID